MRPVLKKALAIRLIILRTTFFMFLFCAQKAYKNSLSANLFLAQEKNETNSISCLKKFGICSQVTLTRQSCYISLLRNILAGQCGLWSSGFSHDCQPTSQHMASRCFLHSSQRAALHGLLVTITDVQTPRLALQAKITSQDGF